MTLPSAIFARYEKEKVNTSLTQRKGKRAKETKAACSLAVAKPLPKISQ